MSLINIDETKKNSLEEEKIREKRNHLLKECDFIVMPDYESDNINKWIDYRKQLRDIPSQSGFPVDVIWPNKPE